MSGDDPLLSGTHLVTIGETLGLISNRDRGSLRYAHDIALSIGGSESNVAIAASRLGVPAIWMGKVGDDAIGALVLERLRGTGIHVIAGTDAVAPTGMMVKERNARQQTNVTYYRHHSAGSRITPNDLDFDLIARASVLHLTGITLALSSSARDTALAAAQHAKASGTLVSFDVNYRSKLWARPEATSAYVDFLPFCDILFAGDDEIQLLNPTAAGTRTAMLDIRRRGVEEVVCTHGALGATALTSQSFETVSAPAIDVVDTVGAGDAFVGGYLAELLLSAPVDQRLATAVASGSMACTVWGDWEGSPTRRELDQLLEVVDVVR